MCFCKHFGYDSGWLVVYVCVYFLVGSDYNMQMCTTLVPSAHRSNIFHFLHTAKILLRVVTGYIASRRTIAIGCALCPRQIIYDEILNIHVNR